jgi:hypothetical protein
MPQTTLPVCLMNEIKSMGLDLRRIECLQYSTLTIDIYSIVSMRFLHTASRLIYSSETEHP